MIFINSTYQEFLARTEGKKVIIFGASSLWHYYMQIFPDFETDVVSRTLFIVDNDVSKSGTISEIGESRVEIRSVTELSEQSDYVILIAVSLAYQLDICEQLLRMPLAENIECYSFPLMIYHQNKADNSCVEPYFASHTTPQIPAQIHSFWFSGEEKPDIYKRCIESWHKYCPDYKIIEWNSDNYDITKNRYMKQAYESRKWAFASDYARLDVLFNHGGIYLDMDVELTASIDWLRNATIFFCRQEDGFVELGSGFGAVQGNGFINEMLEEYADISFLDHAGKMDMMPQPERLSQVFKKHNIQICHDSQQTDDMILLSNEYIVCDVHPELLGTLETQIGVHWHNAGWHSEKNKSIFKRSIEAKSILLRKYFKE